MLTFVWNHDVIDDVKNAICCHEVIGDNLYAVNVQFVIIVSGEVKQIAQGIPRVSLAIDHS